MEPKRRVNDDGCRFFLGESCLKCGEGEQKVVPFSLKPYSRCTLPKTNIAAENRLKPKRKRWYSNHPFSGAFVVSFREGTYMSRQTIPGIHVNLWKGCPETGLLKS